VRVAFVKPVVNQQRTSVVMSHPSANVHGGVLMCSKQGLQPDNDRAVSDWSFALSEPPATLNEMFR
jgi:hypothetical protein